MKKHKYVIIGAGPAGLQTAYFLQALGLDYLVLDAAPACGAAFVKYPVHRKLISINKVFTGSDDYEFNLRHDWNSLLTDDQGIKFSNYDTNLFPHADSMVEYLNGFKARYDLNVQFDCQVTNIRKTDKFVIETKAGDVFEAEICIYAGGFTKANLPENIDGYEHVVDYSDMDIEPSHYNNKRVLVIGKGNSAFETADHLAGNAALIHICSPEKLKFAWQSHYVGHLRAVNNNILDMYQLKSQHAIMDADISHIKKVGDQYAVTFHYKHANGEVETIMYDTVLSCAGFKMADDIWGEGCEVNTQFNGKFPCLKRNFESSNISDLYFAGTLTHVLDYRKATSGFIHGFRYCCKALVNILAKQYEGASWPGEAVPASAADFTQSIIKRVNRASSLWQQPGYFSDVVLAEQGQYISDIPAEYAIELFSSKSVYFVVTMEYGHSESGDIFEAERINKDAYNQGQESLFLHPVIREYHFGVQTSEHHIIEDLEADWTDPEMVEALEHYLTQCMVALSEQSTQTADPERSKLGEDA
ncbi:NAD(P)-binding domain-containing protein [Pseudoalteromonas rubra]|uniref:Pyridine nucleotide-disulfide oxidoreductase n=1 Tax=Pseudoalteromonas rubra TaxID=43658 RepID=A0A0F4QTZ7_9GAMM|nr:NAD(P)-binding domain-containing protein [Pseudoalteromonas rubra]KJZ11138.1 hypothetical protein TW77_06380 [Pseudoalteromonas rubra]